MVRGEGPTEALTASFSSGQQLVPVLACALAARPKVLLLDEPTSSLGYRAARGIKELLQDFDSRNILRVVAHGLNKDRRLARDVFLLREGVALEEVDRERLSAPEGFHASWTSCFERQGPRTPVGKTGWAPKHGREACMEYDVRYMFKATVTGVKKGDVMALVKFQVTDPGEMASAQTTESWTT